MAQQTSVNVDAIACDCIGSRLRLLNRVITNMYDDELRPLGLKVSQLNILVQVSKLGLARPADVCRILQLDASTCSRNVERMRGKGWLEEVPGDDARAHPLRLTAEGEALLEHAVPAWQRAQERVVDLLGTENANALCRITSLVEYEGCSP